MGNVRHWFAAALIVGGIAFAQSGWAKPTGAERQTALKLGGEALDLYTAGDYGAALEKFQKADDLVPAPTLKLHIARCLAKLDRMKEAAEKYREVIATELDASSPQVHRDARKKAVPELAELLEAIPTARAIVKGPGAADAKLLMDGKLLDVSQIGEKMSLDPGHYRFEARIEDRKAVREIDLERGQDERVVLHLPEPEVSSPPPVEGGEDSDALAWQIGGWAAVGLGAAGLAVGAVLGAIVLDEESDLEARCPDRRCPPEAHDDAKSFDGKRIGSTVGFIAGGVFAAAGVTILLLAPGGPAEVAVQPLVGPGFVGLRGAF
jgi:hypothetical protein